MVERYDQTHFSLAESRLLGEQLAAARRAVGVSAGSLACRLGVPEVTLGEYEAAFGHRPLKHLATPPIAAEQG